VRKERGVWADDFVGLMVRRCVSSIRIIPRCAFLDAGDIAGKVVWVWGGRYWSVGLPGGGGWK